MRLFATADLHITEGPRLADQVRALDTMVEIAKSRNVDLSLIVGDIYGTVTPHRSTVAERNAFFQFVARLAEVSPVVVLYGNHDAAGELDALEYVKGRHYVTVVDHAELLHALYYRSDVVTPIALYAMPYPSPTALSHAYDEPVPKSPEDRARWSTDIIRGQLDRWRQTIASERSQRPDTVHIFAGHLSVGEYTTGGGEVIGKAEPTVASSDLDACGFDVGLLGHIHRSQQVAERCYYVGSPTRVTFDDTYPKTCSIVDVGPGVMHHERVPTGARDFVTVDYHWGPEGWGPDSHAYTDVTDKEVRARLYTTNELRAGCPWDDVIADLERTAHRVVPEVHIETVERVRAPQLKKAKTKREKLDAYIDTRDPRPDPEVIESAYTELERLETT